MQWIIILLHRFVQILTAMVGCHPTLCLVLSVFFDLMQEYLYFCLTNVTIFFQCKFLRVSLFLFYLSGLFQFSIMNTEDGVTYSRIVLQQAINRNKMIEHKKQAALLELQNKILQEYVLLSLFFFTFVVFFKTCFDWSSTHSQYHLIVFGDFILGNLTS